MQQEPISYPLVSILYCVKCNWVLRAAWYQQELLQTFTSKATTANESHINSIILRPSFVPGTFQVLVKKSADSDWVQVWDRVKDGGFPEAKILKQSIRNIIAPETQLGHSDKKNAGNRGILMNRPKTDSSINSTNSNNNATSAGVPIAKQRTHTPTEVEVETYGSPRLAATHKTFCEECLDNLPPTWEL